MGEFVVQQHLPPFWVSSQPNIATLIHDITSGDTINKVIPRNAGTSTITANISGSDIPAVHVLVRVADVWSEKLNTTNTQKTWTIKFSKDVKNENLNDKIKLFDVNDNQKRWNVMLQILNASMEKSRDGQLVEVN